MEGAVGGRILTDPKWALWALRQRVVSEALGGATEVLLLVHAPVAQQVFYYFSCNNVGGAGRVFLTSDYSTECYEAEWVQFLPLVLVVLLGFTIVLPGFLSAYLLWYRKSLRTPRISSASGFSTADSTTAPSSGRCTSCGAR